MYQISQSPMDVYAPIHKPFANRFQISRWQYMLYAAGTEKTSIFFRRKTWKSCNNALPIYFYSVFYLKKNVYCRIIWIRKFTHEYSSRNILRTPAGADRQRKIWSAVYSYVYCNNIIHSDESRLDLTSNLQFYTVWRRYKS